MYCLPNITLVIKCRKMSLPEYTARVGKRTGAYTVCVGKPTRKRPLSKHIRRWELNVEMDV
jgi:hypothetical protein